MKENRLKIIKRSNDKYLGKKDIDKNAYFMTFSVIVLRKEKKG